MTHLENMIKWTFIAFITTITYLTRSYRGLVSITSLSCNYIIMTWRVDIENVSQWNNVHTNYRTAFDVIHCQCSQASDVKKS